VPVCAVDNSQGVTHRPHQPAVPRQWHIEGGLMPPVRASLSGCGACPALLRRRRWLSAGASAEGTAEGG